MEASLQLSYGLLDEGSKLHFRQLGIFPASFDRQAARAVWETDEKETDKLLGDLLQASLLEYERDSDRYALHDLVGAFALAQLNETEKETASRRHAGHYVQVLSHADDLYMQGGEAILAGLALYDREAEHIQAGQSWAAKNDPGLGNEYPQCRRLRAKPAPGA